jgi:oligoribonuclease
VKQNNLIWIDLEMTGLNPETDRIIEIATIVTDDNLNIVEQGPVMAIHQSEQVMDAMNSWCVKVHGKTGLTTRVKESSITEKQAEDATLEFIRKYTIKNKSPMCGNSIGQDRRFLRRYMPELHEHFYYRNIDVSTLKELAKRWKPEILKKLVKKGSHIALEDIKESIDELKFYREHFISLTTNTDL